MESISGNFEIIESWKKQGYKIFYVKGVFDRFHEGHEAFLVYLKRKISYFYGEKFKLVVALEGDNIVKLKKGSKRPIDNEIIRKQKLENKNLVDLVLISNNKARFLIKETERLGVDYFVVSEEYIKSLQLLFLIKNKLKQHGVKILLARYKQYPRFGLDISAKNIHTSNLIKEKFFIKIARKTRHIKYLISELLFLLLDKD